MSRTAALNAVTRVGGRLLAKGSKHSPTILTVVGVAGGVTSSVLACKATLGLEDVQEDHQARVNYVRENRDLAEENGVEVNTKTFARDLTRAHLHYAYDLTKLYGPAVSLGGASILCIGVGHGIMHKRQASLIAAYAVVEQGFEQYRGRVRAALGDEKDQEFRFGPSTTETGKDSTGTKVTSTEFETRPNDKSMYARFFDEASPRWSHRPEENLITVKVVQEWATNRLHSRGHLFLNEVYRDLGIPETQAGQVVGWKLTSGAKGDNYVDFGLNEGGEPLRRFINGDEASIFLDFNVREILSEL